MIKGIARNIFIYSSLVVVMLLLQLGCKENDAPLPQGKPNLQLKEVYSESITVAWSKVENAQKYELSLNNNIISIVEALNYTITNLSPATNYTISLSPLNSNGKSGEKESITVTTLKKEVMVDNNNVVLNPFLLAPLTAIVRIGNENLSPKSVEEIRVKVLGKPNGGVAINGTMYPKTDEFKNHFFDITEEKNFNQTVISDEDSVEIPILGLYANYNNTVEYEVETGTHIYKGVIKAQTDKLVDKGLAIEVNIAKPEKMEPGDVTWVTADYYNYDFMFDYKGEVRWIINIRGTSDLRILSNGNLLIIPRWNVVNFGEYTFLGEKINTWNIREGFRTHHDVYEMPSGNFLVPVDLQTERTEGYTTIEDCIFEMNRQTGEIVNYWDLFELMDIKNLNEVWVDSEPGDWYHMNSLWYDEIHDEIIVSGKHGGVVKLSRNGENGDVVNKNKAIIWLMPRFDQYDFYKMHETTKEHILTAIDASGNAYQEQNIYHKDFHWTKDQHNLSIIPSDDGILHFLTFNNTYDTNSSATVEYAVDENAMTVKQVWEYGKDRAELYCSAWSGATFLPKTNNRMMFSAYPTSPKMEVTIDKDIVFEYTIRTSSEDTKWYRTGRINLYPSTK